MSYQTITKRLMMLNQEPNHQSPKEHYNMQLSLFQELQQELAIYNQREQVSKLKITIPTKEESKEKNEKKETTNNPRFFKRDQILEILKRSENLPATKQEYISYLYIDALTLNQLAINSLDKAEKAIYRNEIREILQLITEIKNFTWTPNPQIITTGSKLKKFVFLEQSNQRITVLEDLQKSIPLELYPEFLTLFQSLENETLKRYKNLTPKSFSQVSTKCARLFFTKLNPDYFLILSAIQKDFYTQKHYKEKLNRLDHIVKEQQNNYLAQLQNEAFLKKQEETKNQIDILLRKKEF